MTKINELQIAAKRLPEALFMFSHLLPIHLFTSCFELNLSSSFRQLFFMLICFRLLENFEAKHLEGLNLIQEIAHRRGWSCSQGQVKGI